MADSKGKTIWYQVYEPFGVTYLLNAKDNNNKFWFAGKEKDKTGLSYFGARYYSENQGRFMSPDPVDVKPDLPNTFNRYVYANNNPYKYVDPDGKWAVQIYAAAFGAGAGVVSAWGSGHYDKPTVMKYAAVGASVGLVSTFGGASIFASTIVGGTTNTMGDMALKSWTGNGDQINYSSIMRSFVMGAIGGVASNLLGKIAVPNRNLPAANASYTNYVQPTIRQLAHADSEVIDSVTRSLQSTIRGGIFGITTSGMDSYLSSPIYSGAHNYSGSNVNKDNNRY